MIKYLTMTIEKQKNIALIAHDGKKLYTNFVMKSMDIPLVLAG